jgi:hypothetical protein
MARSALWLACSAVAPDVGDFANRFAPTRRWDPSREAPSRKAHGRIVHISLICMRHRFAPSGRITRHSERAGILACRGLRVINALASDNGRPRRMAPQLGEWPRRRVGTRSPFLLRNPLGANTRPYVGLCPANPSFSPPCSLPGAHRLKHIARKACPKSLPQNPSHQIFYNLLCP